MTAKPICLVYFHRHEGAPKIFEIQDALADMLKDYHVIVVPKYEDPIIDMKVFYEKDFTKIQYEELKKLITDSIKQL